MSLAKKINELDTVTIKGTVVDLHGDYATVEVFIQGNETALIDMPLSEIGLAKQAEVEGLVEPPRGRWEVMTKGYEGMTKKLSDDGLLIEAGWQALKHLTLQDAPEIQVREMRKAFFAGAQHLYASIMTLLEEGQEPTENDLRRMEMIHVELEAFVDSLKREAKGDPDPL